MQEQATTAALRLTSGSSGVPRHSVLGGVAGVISSSIPPSVPFDPTCPVSVAMAKLKGMVDLANPDGAAPAAEEAAALSTRLSSVAALLPGALHSRMLQPETDGGADGAEGGGDAEGGGSGSDEEDDVPIECLRFFKLLNRKSQT